jgi:hypothetical protein
LSFRRTAWLLAALSLPVSAFGQSPGAPSRTKGQTLDFSGDVLGAFDTEPFAENANASPAATDGTLYSSLRGRLSYRFRSSRMTFTSAAGSDLQYYPSLNGLLLGQHNASASVSTGIGRRVSLHASHATGYSPFFSSMPLGTAVETAATMVAPPVDAAVGRGDAWRHQSDVALSWRVGRRTDVLFSYGRSAFSAAGTGRADHRAGVRITRPVTRRTGVRLGYFERVLTGGGDGRTIRLHEVDAGIDYARALSVTRRTTVTFGTGSGLVTDPSGTRVHFLGNVALAHQMGRTWAAQARYNRSLEVVEIVEAPVIADALAVSIGGAVGRKVQLSAGTTYTRAGGAGGQDVGLESYNVSTRATVSLTRQTGAYAEYFVHSYRFGRAPLLVDVPRRGLRHGVRVGLSVSAPLVR